jgi:hypothetical protein
VVTTVSVEVAGVVPAIVTEAGLNEQVGREVAPVAGPITVQVRPTAPVNPLAGVIVTVLVPDDPACNAGIVVADTPKPGVAVTVTVPEEPA